MDREISKRLKWIELYEETKDAGLVCLKSGISRPTLRKWIKRYKELGIEGLKEQSRKPKNSPRKKITDKEKNLIKLLRERKLGARRIQSEMKRLHNISLSLSTIHKVLRSIAAKPINRLKKKTKHTYQKDVPGERVQLDVCKIAPGIYQYTAIDDCTRIKVLAIYSRRTAKSSLEFLEYLLEEFPFPVQRIQTDRGKEFFATTFQQRLMDYGIKFRPIKPASPHLNGKVERTQRTDLVEFWSLVELKSPNLKELLQNWQDYYNQERPHSSLSGKTPWEKWFDLARTTPIWDEVFDSFDITKERIQEQNFSLDLAIKKLK